MTLPHNFLTPTRYGLMLANAFDAYVGRSLITYGEFSECEIAFLRPYLHPDSVVLDIGANIGALTLPFARLAGTVIAFEPVQAVYQLLCANVALNSLTNVLAFPYAVGNPPEGQDTITAPRLDVTQPGNFGAGELGGEGDRVICVGLDAIALPAPTLIKVDVEGMEADVLRGAREYITEHTPVLYVESDREHKRADLLAVIDGLGYDAWWHLPPLFNADNFRRQAANPWPGVYSYNLLCLPRGGPHAIPDLERAQ